METTLEILVAVLLLMGASFALIGSYGLAKLSDFFKRLHAPTKATTLGLGGVLIASTAYFSLLRPGPGISVHELLITVFLFLTAPISAHMVSRAALVAARAQVPPPPPSQATQDASEERR